MKDIRFLNGDLIKVRPCMNSVFMNLTLRCVSVGSLIMFCNPFYLVSDSSNLSVSLFFVMRRIYL